MIWLLLQSYNIKIYFSQSLKDNILSELSIMMQKTIGITKGRLKKQLIKINNKLSKQKKKHQQKMIKRIILKTLKLLRIQSKTKINQQIDIDSNLYNSKYHASELQKKDNQPYSRNQKNGSQSKMYRCYAYPWLSYNSPSFFYHYIISCIRSQKCHKSTS